MGGRAVSALTNAAKRRPKMIDDALLMASLPGSAARWPRPPLVWWAAVLFRQGDPWHGQSVSAPSLLSRRPSRSFGEPNPPRLASGAAARAGWPRAEALAACAVSWRRPLVRAACPRGW